MVGLFTCALNYQSTAKHTENVKKYEGKSAKRELSLHSIFPKINIISSENQLVLDNHDHVPNQEQCQSEIFKYSLKRKAEDQTQLPSTQILRTEMDELSDGVFSQLYLTVII
uniref:Uncharacterized protein n=1 Tax=Schizaphis graminum TaxID=13262 RepID=A0A2S2P330_SCHGA